MHRPAYESSLSPFLVKDIFFHQRAKVSSLPMVWLPRFLSTIFSTSYVYALLESYPARHAIILAGIRSISSSHHG